MDDLIEEIKGYLIEYDKMLTLRLAGACTDVQVYEAECLLLGTLLKWKREHLNGYVAPLTVVTRDRGPSAE